MKQTDKREENMEKAQIQTGYEQLARAILTEEEQLKPAARPRRKHKRAGRIRKGDTLCWTCRRCTGGQGCPWVAGFIPVPGWDAGQTVFFYRDEQGQIVQHYSYLVRQCPLYKKG